MFKGLCLTIIFNFWVAQAAQANDQARILVLSAASASTVVRDIAEDFSRRTGINIRLSIASSGTLARQITQGAPADIYVSASEQWVKSLSASGDLSRNHIRPLMRNRLVIVAPAQSSLSTLLDLTKPVAVLAALDGGRLAMGDPSHVPAGQYGELALLTLGLWPAVRDRMAYQVNVRAVLAMVERGETPLGVVYATDAALSDKVKIAAVVPAEAHPPIQYVAAILTNRVRPETVSFLEDLTGPAAQDLIQANGFATSSPQSAAP